MLIYFTHKSKSNPANYGDKAIRAAYQNKNVCLILSSLKRPIRRVNEITPRVKECRFNNMPCIDRERRLEINRAAKCKYRSDLNKVQNETQRKEANGATARRAFWHPLKFLQQKKIRQEKQT